ncbi:hypothetical protein [Alcanivorax sp. DP30]|uniref:hypothetical protein n=1 Tax=Alcanivorax sp. DP30 TaxID=2606217 RepID=UPI00136B67B1|nr:hypothetical protein [Alcanivorax sp. DP30]MZR62376.1 hypothetical protein [Alcanivorax sp. DP30]
MNDMIPKNVLSYIDPLPESDLCEEIKARKEKFRNLYGEDYVRSIVWTAQEAREILDFLGVSKDSAMYHFYQNAFDYPKLNCEDNIFGLSQIRDDYIDPFWKGEFGRLEKRYLLISSPEGEHSFFYDKETDSVSGVDWDDMSLLVGGVIRPEFQSFYDFLEWYYGVEP